MTAHLSKSQVEWRCHSVTDSAKMTLSFCLSFGSDGFVILSKVQVGGRWHYVKITDPIWRFLFFLIARWGDGVILFEIQVGWQCHSVWDPDRVKVSFCLRSRSGDGVILSEIQVGWRSHSVWDPGRMTVSFCLRSRSDDCVNLPKISFKGWRWHSV